MFLISRVVIAGIVRTVYLSQVQSSNFDKTWLGFNVFAAGIAEGNVAIVCACAPSLKSCFRGFFHDAMSSRAMRSAENGTSRSMDSAKIKASRSAQSKASWKGGPVLSGRSVDVKHAVVETYEHGLDDLTPAVREESKEFAGAPVSPLSWLDTTGEHSDSKSAL
jgi:hypothetical protein